MMYNVHRLGQPCPCHDGMGKVSDFDGLLPDAAAASKLEMPFK